MMIQCYAPIHPCDSISDLRRRLSRAVYCAALNRTANRSVARSSRVVPILSDVSFVRKTAKLASSNDSIHEPKFREAGSQVSMEHSSCKKRMTCFCAHDKLKL